jgi:hypothetical protein
VLLYGNCQSKFLESFFICVLKWAYKIFEPDSRLTFFGKWKWLEWVF